MAESMGDAQIQVPEANPIRPCKIVSSFKDVLTLNENGLQETLGQCIKGLPQPEQQELPVAIISIIGPPSCGKSFLTNLVINYYKSDQDDGGWLEKLTKKSKEGAHHQFTGFTWHSVTTPQPGIFKPSDEEIATSGVYLWPQLFIRKSNEGGKSMLILILHLCLGRDKTDEDVHTLERFLIMASSRMTEIDYGNNDFRILNEVANIKSAMNELPGSCQKEQYCDSILYVFCSNGASSSSKSSADEEAKEELLQVAEDSAGNKIKDPSVLNSFKHVNLAPIKHIKGTLEDSLLKVEKNMTRQLKKIVELITDETEVASKMVKENETVKKLLLADIANFFKVTVNEVNVISSQQDSTKREAIDYSKFQRLPESSTLPLLPPDDSCHSTVHDIEKLQPVSDSSYGTKGDVPPPPNDSYEKCLIRPPKLNICNFGSTCTVLHTREKSGNVAEEVQQGDSEITAHTAPVTVAITSTIPSISETSLKPNEDASHETPTETVTVQPDPQLDLSATLPAEVVGKDEPDNAQLSDMDARQDEHEKVKQKKENMKEALEKIATKAAEEVKSKLPCTTKEWLRNRLSHSNISEINKIYSSLLLKITERAKISVDSIHWDDVGGRVDSTARPYCEPYLQAVESRIKTFYTSMKRQFELLDCFTEIELNEVGNNEYRKVISDIPPDNAEISNLVGLGCNTLMKYFHDQNQKIINHEETLAVSLIPKALGFYNEEMKQFLSNGVYSPRKLKEIHLELMEKLIASFRLAFKLVSRETICASVESKLETLRATLENEFVQHFALNMANIKIVQGKITDIQRSAKAAYQKKIEELLQQNGDGLAVDELHRQHGVIVKEAKKLITMDIRKKMGEDEPSAVHVESLQNFMNVNFEAVRGQNHNNLHAARKRSEKQRKKLEEESRKKMEQEYAINIPKTPIASCPYQQFGSTSKLRQLPPLVFQLQPELIKMGINLDGRMHLLLNSSGEEGTPLVVGMNREGGLVYGSDVHNAHLGNQTTKSRVNGPQWCVIDYFIKPGYYFPRTEKIPGKDGNYHVISAEFLLAFILRKLKEQAEGEFKGQFDVCIITVPFWFCSSHRIQVKHGGLIAGFSEVHLINEVSAATFACISSDIRKHSSNYMLVISQTGKGIDAFVYTYSTGAKQLAMVGHYGGFHPAQKGRFAFLLSPRASLSDWWNGKEVATVKHFCEKALKQAKESKYSLCGKNGKLNEVLVLAESGEWKSIIQDVGRAHGRIVGDTPAEQAAIIGAMLLSSTPDIIKDKVRDLLAFDVLRKCVNDDNIAKVFPRENPLPPSCRQMTTMFPGRCNQAEFFQSEGDSSTNIGWLQMDVPYNHQGQVCLNINNEGIIELKDVSLVCPSTNQKTQSQNYSWRTPNLGHQEITRLQNLMDSFAQENNDQHNLHLAVEELKNLCKEMQQLELELPESDSLKDQITKKLAEATSISEDPNSALEQIQIQTESLVTMRSHFEK